MCIHIISLSLLMFMFSFILQECACCAHRLIVFISMLVVNANVLCISDEVSLLISSMFAHAANKPREEQNIKLGLGKNFLQFLKM